MKFLKVIFASVTVSFVISLIASIISYTPVSEREPNVYYFSVWESFIFAIIYITPILLVVSISAFIIYIFMKKVKCLPQISKVIFSILIAASLTSLTLYMMNKNNVTDNIYLIPKGFEGDVYTFFDIKGAPMIEKEDGYDVHIINEKGYYLTSKPSMNDGVVTDKYYYVDEKGNRTPISNKCVSSFGTGGYSIYEDEEEIDLSYTGFKLTKDHCSDEFRQEDHGMGENIDRIIDDILREHFGVER